MLTEDQLKDLESKFPGCARVVGPGEAFEIIVRKPTRQEYRMWRTKVANPQTLPDASEELIRQCAVHPDRAGVEALFNEFPAIAESDGAQAAIKRLTGMSSQEAAKL